MVEHVKLEQTILYLIKKIKYDDDNNEIIYELEQKLNKTGTTEDRPERPSIGFIYKDTTLDKLIIWEGTKWINLDGTELV